MTIHWKAVEQYFSVVVFVILENLSILDLTLLGVKGFLVSGSMTVFPVKFT